MKSETLSRRDAIKRTGLFAGAMLAAGQSPIVAAAPEAKTDATFVYCLNTGTIRGQKLTLVQEIETAAQAGYQAIEPWISAIQQHVKSGGSLPDLKKRLSDSGLTMESAIGFPKWAVDDDEQRAKGLEQVKVEMDLIAQIGGKRMAAPPVGATDKPGDLAKAAERYRALLELGDQMGVVPQLELWGSSKHLSRLGECAYVAIESRHPKACIVADIFHLYRSGADFDGLKMFGPGVLQVFHMNDYPADPPRDKINDSYRVFPGDGVAPMTQILQALRESGGRKVLSLEIFNRKYWEQDALVVAKAGLEKMKAAVAAATKS